MSGLAQLIVFIRYIASGKLEEELLMCVALSGTSTGEDIFSAVVKKTTEWWIIVGAAY